MMRGFGSSLFALCVLLLARGAWASLPFDGAIKSELELPSDGPSLCTVCHKTDEGGPDSVIKPFGVSALKLGLQEKDVQKLKEVLQQMRATNVDSDCDGIGDIVELEKGGDPNSADRDAASDTGAACAMMEPPRYGFYCTLSALSGTKGAAPSSATFAPAALVAVLFARRSRRVTPSGPLGSRRPA